MPLEYQGQLSYQGGRFAIVVSRYNDSITGKLLAGACEEFQKNGVPDDALDIAHVPGAWELPLIADRLAATGGYQAIVCLGAVIRGETTHDEHINRQVSLSLGQISLHRNLPVVFGVLTCNSLEQAIHRSGGNVGNKGVESAACALEMASLVQQLHDSAK
ncbi:6,7-dimethyl-8-ribityllumazine synthase [Lignipirellula cremea]|uniref:6,7-dimethyl-8-ribityllumazine synthase n=1 Tax=Lignipirellula cremea TaxID=2528010 RepID=A0A518E360_9BACT|nr:6,7-dimethyl-8-ribityllumazine synthase [Lignipirellula cremea]QDU98502.1 6,7-dimethyl-8-ribityllumazine synthase [Lignipirellula cremea]